MAPQSPAKKKKKEKAPPVFNLSDIDSHSSEGSLDEATQEAIGESKPTAPPFQMVADSEDDPPNPSPREARVVVTQKTAHGPSESSFEHPFLHSTNLLIQQHLALEASMQQIRDENNAALRRLDALDKSLGRAEKKAADAAEVKERLEKEVVAAVEA